MAEAVAGTDAGVDIFLLQLGKQLPGAEVLGWLSTEEQEAARQFSREELRHRYLQVRAAVRSCLAAASGLSPERLDIRRDTSGKPWLHDSDLHFNLSHCGDRLAIAIRQHQPLGIDLERTSHRRSWRAIAERYFHVAETAALAQAGAGDFFRLWCLKEAFFKATGGGIASGLDRARFEVSPPLIRHRLDPMLGEPDANWRFFLWQAGDNDHLALALPGTGTGTDRIRLHYPLLPAITGVAATPPRLELLAAT